MTGWDVPVARLSVGSRGIGFHLMSPVAQERVRLAELVALFSLGADLGLGQPMEHMIRACLIALRLGERLDLAESQRGVVYYSGLLAWVGCHTDAYEQAKWFGDDTTLKRDAHYQFDLGGAGPAISFLLRHVGGPGGSLAKRTRVGIAFAGEGLRAMRELAENHYRATDELVQRLGLESKRRPLSQQSFLAPALPAIEPVTSCRFITRNSQPPECLATSASVRHPGRGSNASTAVTKSPLLAQRRRLTSNKPAAAHC